MPGAPGDVAELPPRLSIMLFRNRVLLPGAVVRIRCTSPTNVRLVEQELWQKEDRGLIGVLPVRDLQQSDPASPPPPPPPSSSSLPRLKARKGLGKQNQELVQWHPRGVAARALHLSRGMEKPSGRMEQAEKDPEVRQFKVVASELISALEQKQRTVGRTKILLETTSAHRLADIFVANFENFEDRLAMLDAVDIKQRLVKATEIITRHLQTIKVAEKISQKVEGNLSKSQKEFLLRQQMKAIKEELGDNDEDEDDVVALEKKMQNVGMPANVWKHTQRELRRLRKLQPQQPGYGCSRAYLELLAELPWQISSEERDLGLVAAKERLDSEHYGLGKIKKRIIEYLAVRKLKPDASGPVLCFVGPPGVGKTSLASSIAGALGRLFIRISLGGVKDEADIRIIEHLRERMTLSLGMQTFKTQLTSSYLQFHIGSL
ncbi:hypothetical protein SELMODRAFT_444435, partial [Selaginella moellendorffii]